MRAASVPLLLLTSVWGLSSCATLLEVDGDYALVEASGGSTGTGGTTRTGGGPGAGSGGAPGSGGDSSGAGGVNAGPGGSGGSLGSGGAPPPPPPDGEAPCPGGEKRCTVEGNEVCVAPDPSVGCGPSGCDQCQAPQGGFGVCVGEACDFGCFDGFVRNGGSCDLIPLPEGGNVGGASGAGGRSNTCTKDADCPTCGPAAGCCTLIPTGRCGCNFLWCVPSSF